MINTNLLSPGTLLRNGTYRVERQLSSGGYGNTYVVTNVSFGETYAMQEFYIKGINERDSGSKEISVSNKENEYQFETMKSKFCKEAVRIRKLDNPHIVKVYDMFDENGTSYYIMDYIDGESLSSLLKRTGKPVTEEQLFGYLRQILSALSAIHNKGIWHLDLKPGNIMIDKRGNVYLIDFGASKQFHDSEGKSVSTSTGLCYTPGYAPLEQTNQDFKKFGPWTDIYALGATLYNLLTAQKPLMPTDILIEGFSLPVEVSSRTRDLISWMMRPRYLDRPQSVEDIRSYLEQGHLSSVASQSETDTNTEAEEETECMNTNPAKENDRTVYKHESEETIVDKPITNTHSSNRDIHKVGTTSSVPKSTTYINKKDSNISRKISKIVILLPILMLGGFLVFVVFSNIGSSRAVDTRAAIEENYVEAVDSGSVTLYGTVHTYPITMNINIKGSVVKGTYYYNRKGADNVLTLSGFLDGDNMEIFETDENGIQTGHFKGYYINGEYQGEFVTRQGESMQFRLTI